MSTNTSTPPVHIADFAMVKNGRILRLTTDEIIAGFVLAITAHGAYDPQRPSDVETLRATEEVARTAANAALGRVPRDLDSDPEVAPLLTELCGLLVQAAAGEQICRALDADPELRDELTRIHPLAPSALLAAKWDSSAPDASAAARRIMADPAALSALRIAEMAS